MAKSSQRLRARKLKKHHGLSNKQIAEKVGVSRTTISRLCREIQLTQKQIERLIKKRKANVTRGSLKGAWIQRKRKLDKIKNYQEQAKKEIRRLNKRELFLTGIALYWAEGQKKQRKLGLTSSDPKMILFFIKWLQEIYQIPKNRLKCYVGINEIYEKRTEAIENYWSNLTNIPKSQFTKTSLKKVKNKKQYANLNSHYGTLSVRVSRGADLQYRLLGWIEALRIQAG